MGAALAVVVGLSLLFFSWGEPWVHGSYDNLFRFGTRPVTNQVVLVLMDNEAYSELGQSRDNKPPWDRNLHAKLLNKLADDRCPLAVLDVRFTKLTNPETDRVLAGAMARLTNVVLAGTLTEPKSTGIEAVRAVPPINLFLTAAQSHWGVAWFDRDSDFIVRRHWPFPSPDSTYESLPWVAAKISGAQPDTAPVKRWLRYYDSEKTWTTLSYHIALAKGPGYFQDKVVFIGSDPFTKIDDNELDEFLTPYFKWTGETVGGVKILATEYLNLMNGDALHRWGGLAETALLIFTGALLGAGLTRLGRRLAIIFALSGAFVFMIVAVVLSYYANFWFPWLVVVGGQMPCALAWAMIAIKPSPAAAPVKAGHKKPETPNGTIILSFPEDELPDAPEYEITEPPIGQGGFGKVWICRNAIGQWQALKAVYESTFGDNRSPYEAEFKGLQRYKPVSEKHPGLLRIDLVSKMKPEGYFYYVMELGDAQVPGWEKSPQLYKPRDLENLRKQSPDRRLPIAECLRIVTGLADALNFLHQQKLTHRDIKPSNVIFVNDRPKLADIGLVADVRPVDQMHTMVGTLGYMPMPPEKPGTPQADIYALGMVLYVISTGCDPGFFPDITTNLMEKSNHQEFIQLNAIVLKACQPDLAKRYQTTAEMFHDLQAASPLKSVG